MNEIQEELAKIAKRNGGVLMPAAVVKAARRESSPLHDRFTWDDSKAAQKHRLWEARQLIVTVRVIVNDSEPFNAYISLKPDRPEGGGYRAMVEVLSDKELRAQMLGDALAELEVFRKKYKDLKELASVFAATKKVRSKAP